MSTALSRLHGHDLSRKFRAQNLRLSSRSAAIFKNTFQFICCISRDAPYFAIVRGFGFVSKAIIFQLFKAASFAQ